MAPSIYNPTMAEAAALPGCAGGFPRPVIYDTTLRDGEQMPGVRFTSEQKLEIARLLDSAGVPQLEVGFPAVSPGECEAIKGVAAAGLDADILVLTRLTMEDVELARACDADMALLFVASSPSHLTHKLRTDIETIAERIPVIIDRVKAYGITPSFSTEDSTRTPLEDLRRLNTAAVGAGAERVGVTDTVGCASPHAIQRLVRDVKEFTPVPLSIHLHNDFGMATANAVMGVCAGMIMMASKVDDKRVTPLGLMPFKAIRNFYGRQVHSFTADVKLSFDGNTFKAPFIRAPGIEKLSPKIEILATYDDNAVMIGFDKHIALSFHPELTRDTRIHEYWLNKLK